VAVLFAGSETMFHLYVSGSPLTSVDLEPSNCTRAPTRTTWFGPALARGGEFCVVTVTNAAALSKRPSFTISCITYAPALSITNDAETLLAPDNVVTLPAGCETIVQWYVRGSPPTSDEALPLRTTVAPIFTL